MARHNSDFITRDDILEMFAQMFDQARRVAGGNLTEHKRLENVEATRIVRVGPTLGEAIDSYLEAKQRSWTAKTYAGRVRKLEYLRDCLGASAALAQVSPDDIRSYRDAIRRLRAHKGARRLVSFASRQTDSQHHRIDPKTAILIFEPTKAFFRWCTAEQGYLAANPAENIRLALPKTVKGAKARRPFNSEELETLFSSPLFTGSRSRGRRFEAGTTIIRDAKFWLPILGYYTGARLGELVQLHMGDVDFSQGQPFINVTEENTGKVGSGDAKHVKSEAGVRRVPPHPDLMELGFRQFVAARSASKRPSRRLFHEVRYGSDGQASTVFSKFFGRLLDKVGLPDPALVFHSFRHGTEDALRNALQPQYVIDRIIGHSDGSTSAGYGVGVSLEVAHSAILAMKLKVSLPELWNASAKGGATSSVGS